MDKTPGDSTDPIEKLRGGGRQALATLLDQYRDRLRRMVELRLDARLRARLDASDVVQEAFIDVSRDLHAYLADPKLPPLLWLRLHVGRRSTTLHRQRLGTRTRYAGPEISLNQGGSAPRPAPPGARIDAPGTPRHCGPGGPTAGERIKLGVQEALNSLDAVRPREVPGAEILRTASADAQAALVLGISRGGRGEAILAHNPWKRPQVYWPRCAVVREGPWSDAHGTPVPRDYGRFDELGRGVRRLPIAETRMPSYAEEYAERLPEMADEIREMFPALAESRTGRERRPRGAIPPARRSAPFHPASQGVRRITEIVPGDRPGRDGGRPQGREQDQPGPSGGGAEGPARPCDGGRQGGTGAVPPRGQVGGEAAPCCCIVPVFEVGQDGETAYYAMQFIEGQGLDQVIEELTGLSDQGRDGEMMTPDPTTTAAATGPPEPTLGRVARLLVTGRLEAEAAVSPPGDAAGA